MRRSRVLRQIAPSADDFAATFLTDTEGNVDYLLRWAASSRVVAARRDAGGRVRLDFRRPDAPGHHLVFGGDACDHGPGDCMFDRKVQFKPKTPTGVVPAALNPAHPSRKLAFLSPNGMPGSNKCAPRPAATHERRGVRRRAAPARAASSSAGWTSGCRRTRRTCAAPSAGWSKAGRARRSCACCAPCLRRRWASTLERA